MNNQLTIQTMEFNFMRKHLISFLFVLSSPLTMLCYASDPISTIDRPVTPTEIYGSSECEVLLTIGNGGAGPTCVLQALSEDYLALKNLKGRIAWIQTISRFTLENLKEKIIDIALTYEEEPQIAAVNEGWASNRTLIFNDHFILIGPKGNPAGISPTDSAAEAFKKIASEASFFSRHDFSGSHQRELQIWDSISIDPDLDSTQWYHTENVFPSEALKIADKKGLYTLNDRGTLLATHHELKNMAVYVQESNVLMNRCHALLQNNPSEIAKDFLNYLVSPRAQSIISKYSGKDLNCIDCCPLFTPANTDAFLDVDCLKRLGLTS